MTKLLIARSTLWDRVIEGLLGKANDVGPEPLITLVYILGGIMFGVLTVGLVILLVRYFVRWGYEEIFISRGRDSLAGRKVRASPVSTPRERLTQGRRRRKLVPGLRRRA